jgi:carboxymethylenebutenolidase
MHTMMKARAFVIVGTLFALTATASAATLKSSLPSAQNAKALLEETQRCRDWVAVPMGSSIVLAFVVYPMRADKAPVVLVTAPREGTNAWVRAVSDQLAAEGFIAIAPDLLTNMGPATASGRGDSESFATPQAMTDALRRMGPAEIARRMDAVREYARTLPAANEIIASVELDSRPQRITVATGDSRPVASHGKIFPMNDAGWRDALGDLNRDTNNHFVPDTDAHMGMDMNMGMNVGMNMGMNMDMSQHMQHMGMTMAASQGPFRNPPPPPAPAAISFSEKQPNLPAGYYTALSTLAKSKLQKEWVDIPLGDVKLHTWVEYPAGDAKAGVVIVMQFGTGMDEWVRAVADQLALEGFIAVAPDLWSGTGPNGGGRDSFQFVDDAMKAGAKISADEAQRRYKVARDWALKLPRANGKTGSIGFCAGGGNSFRFAGEVPELNAAVVYYGTPPTPEVMAKIKAPVLGFYGENDARVTSTVAPTITAMEKLGKVYESHVYAKTTHSFLYFQDMAGNPGAVNDAWPRTVTFLKRYLN